MRIFISATCAVACVLAACATAPKSRASRDSLEARADATLDSMKAKDPALNDVLQSSYGYAVFPNIGKAGAVVGAAYGRGVVYEQGRKVGYVELNQGSFGAQLGAQSYSELIVFRDQFDLQRLKSGSFSLGGNASAVALTAGAAATARFQNGIAVFVMPRGGLMAELSVSGQQINFQPRG